MIIRFSLNNFAARKVFQLRLCKLSNGKHFATSAGVNPKAGKPIDEIAANNADVIVSFKSAEELPGFVRRRNVRYWNVADPARRPIEFHRKTRDLVKSKVESLLAKI